MQTRRQDGALRREAVLDAGLEIFSLVGLHGASLDQIAERAGLSKTNLLYYFPSKEELYVAVLRRVQDVWLQSSTSMAFTATYADDNFCFGKGLNTPTAFAPTVEGLEEARA